MYIPLIMKLNIIYNWIKDLIVNLNKKKLKKKFFKKFSYIDFLTISNLS
jgi:hypothetical protein